MSRKSSVEKLPEVFKCIKNRRNTTPSGIAESLSMDIRTVNKSLVVLEKLNLIKIDTVKIGEKYFSKPSLLTGENKNGE